MGLQNVYLRLLLQYGPSASLTAENHPEEEPALRWEEVLQMTETADRKQYDVVVAEDELLILENLVKKSMPCRCRFA